MVDHLFVSYSSVDGKNFALRLVDKLTAGPPPMSVWMDKRELRPGENWTSQLVEAIRTCKALLFVMTRDSVEDASGCTSEWVRALKYKKPVVPLLFDPEAELPYRLDSREYIDFTGSYDSALARLRNFIAWLETPEGRLRQLTERLKDAKRDLPRAPEEQQPRIQAEIDELTRQIAQQNSIVDDPKGAAIRVQESIDAVLEAVRAPAKPTSGTARQVKFVNPPPAAAPRWFENRHSETAQIGDFLQDPAQRVMTVVGRGGIGKTAMVCRLLKSLEAGRLPDDGPELPVDGIVYLSNARTFHRVTVPELFAGLSQLLPDDVAARLDALYKDPRTGTEQMMRALLEQFSSGRTVVLLDNFEDTIDIETGRIREGELREALQSLLQLPVHGLKVVITTRVAPDDLARIEPGRQRWLNIEKGLESPFAEKVLRLMDKDGTLGLRDAPEALLSQARERTRGNPRALEHLYGILSADPDTSLEDILEDTKRLIPEQVVDVLVGEAFSRLDAAAQLVMQALAAYRYPVPAAAVDYLVQPYRAGMDSASTLKRLVKMQFARRDASRYYVHQVDRDYALSRIEEGSSESESPRLTRIALTRRAAEWFKETRKPRAEWHSLEDLAPQLSEFELRVASEQFDEAAQIILDIEPDGLTLWGHYGQVVERLERVSEFVVEPTLASQSSQTLGFAHLRIGNIQAAIECAEAGLKMAAEEKNERARSLCVGLLGQAYMDLGQADRAIEYYKQSLEIARAIKDRGVESFALGSLAIAYGSQGDLEQEIACYKNTIDIDRELKDKQSESVGLQNLSAAYLDRGDLTMAMETATAARSLATELNHRIVETASLSTIGDIYLEDGDVEGAIQHFSKAVELADEMAARQPQVEARTNLALAFLVRGSDSEARRVAEEARGYFFPVANPAASVTLGVVALRQRDLDAAREAFQTAAHQADAVLSPNGRTFEAMDMKALACCGRALCESIDHLQPAKDLFREARAITVAPGHVRRVLRIFDALAKADATGVLRSARPFAAGLTRGMAQIVQ